MKLPIVRAVLTSLFLTGTLPAQVPQLLNYQGRVAVGTPPVNFDGTGQFKFALVDGGVNQSVQATAFVTSAGSITFIIVGTGGSGYVAPPAVTITDASGTGATAVAIVTGGAVTSIQVTNGGSGYSPLTTVTIAPPPPNIFTTAFWNNAGTVVGIAPATAPATAVSLPVTKGIYSALLGDTNLANMAAIPTGVFVRPDLRLRVWFNDGANGFQLLSPDQRLAPAPYLADGSVTGMKIEDLAITSAKIANGAITGPQIASGSLNATLFATPAAAAPGQVLGYGAGGLTWTAPGGAFSLNGTDAYYNGGNVGIGTMTPAAKLDVRGSLVLESGASPGLFTGTGNAELNRYLVLLNSPNAQSASGMKAGGVLVSNDYAYANPGKSDLIVKGNVMMGTATQASQTRLTIQTTPGLSVSKWGMEQTDGTVRLATYVGDGGYRTGLGTRSNHPLSFFVNDGGPSMTIATDGGVSIDSASGIALSAADGGPMVTRGNDPFNSNAPLDLDGHGRWGLFKDLSSLICGFPDIAGKSFQVCKYTPDGGRNVLMIVDQSGKVGIGTGPIPGPQQALHVIGNILASGTITGSSDRNVKRDFTPVNSSEVLKKVAALPISTWSYIADDGIRHLGPMAQDFHSAFDVGLDDKHISMVDADGVALAAIQGLDQKVEAKDAEIRNLRERIEKLEQLLDRKPHTTERKQP